MLGGFAVLSTVIFHRLKSGDGEDETDKRTHTSAEMFLDQLISKMAWFQKAADAPHKLR